MISEYETYMCCSTTYRTICCTSASVCRCMRAYMWVSKSECCVGDSDFFLILFISCDIYNLLRWSYKLMCWLLALWVLYKLLMMGKRMPETCWAVFKRQAINRRDRCIWLVDLFENPECKFIVPVCSEQFPVVITPSAPPNTVVSSRVSSKLFLWKWRVCYITNGSALSVHITALFVLSKAGNKLLNRRPLIPLRKWSWCRWRQFVYTFILPYVLHESRIPLGWK
jgi:hypothetical protein